MPNHIHIDGRVIDTTSRDVDVLYLCSFEDYLKQTNINIEQLINSIKADISMLYKARDRYTEVYRELPYLSDKTPALSALLSDITKTIDKKETKLNKYKELVWLN